MEKRYQQLQLADITFSKPDIELNQAQKSILIFLMKVSFFYNELPQYRQIAKALDLELNMVGRSINRLQEKGCVTKIDRAEGTLKVNREMVIPVFKIVNPS
jgi:hypothetical protein